MQEIHEIDDGAELGSAADWVDGSASTIGTGWDHPAAREIDHEVTKRRKIYAMGRIEGVHSKRLNRHLVGRHSRSEVTTQDVDTGSRHNFDLHLNGVAYQYRKYPKHTLQFDPFSVD
jgi:hypothetical protein